MMTATSLNDLKIYTASPGRIVLVIGPYCWGRGTTGQQALQQARANASRSFHPPRGSYRFIDASEEAYVNDVGGVTHSLDSEPSFEIGTVTLPAPR